MSSACRLAATALATEQRCSRQQQAALQSQMWLAGECLMVLLHLSRGPVLLAAAAQVRAQHASTQRVTNSAVCSHQHTAFDTFAAKHLQNMHGMHQC